MAADLRGDLLGAARPVGATGASRAPGTAMLWAGILAGPIAFAADLLVRYALVKWSCGTAHTAVLTVSTVTSLVAIACGAALARRSLVMTPPDATTDGGQPIDRAKFMAIVGQTFSALFALVVTATAFPQWVLDGCR
jgi:hypothetical protein